MIQSIRDEKISKRKRTVLTAGQQKMLNAFYKRCAFPDSEQRLKLGEMLNMSPRSIQIWFQNQRQKTKSFLNDKPGESQEPSEVSNNHEASNLRYSKINQNFQDYLLESKKIDSAGNRNDLLKKNTNNYESYQMEDKDFITNYVNSHCQLKPSCKSDGINDKDRYSIVYDYNESRDEVGNMNCNDLYKNECSSYSNLGFVSSETDSLENMNVIFVNESDMFPREEHGHVVEFVGKNEMDLRNKNVSFEADKYLGNYLKIDINKEDSSASETKKNKALEALAYVASIEYNKKFLND